MKVCTKCNNEKELSCFHFQKKSENKLAARCKDCDKKIQYEYRHKDIVQTRLDDKRRYQTTKKKRVEYAKEYRKKYPERTRATNWKVKYGITPDDFYSKLNEQNNKCAICNRDMEDYGKIFCVDHNHKTNKVRGLLCDPCNYGLGFYEKHKEKYKKYLLKHD